MRGSIIITKKELIILIDETAVLNKQVNKLSKELDEKKAKIKESFAELKLSELSGTDFTAKVKVNVKESLNEQRTIDCIKTVGADWLLHTKEYFKDEEIETSLMTGELDAGLFSACVDVKETKVLNFNKNKRETNNAKESSNNRSNGIK